MAVVGLAACTGSRGKLHAYAGSESPVVCYRVMGAESQSSLIAGLKQGLAQLSPASRSVLECDTVECMARSEWTQGCDLSIFLRISDYTFTVPSPRGRQTRCGQAPAVEETIDYSATARVTFSVFDHKKGTAVASGTADGRTSDEQVLGRWVVTRSGMKGEQCGWGPGNSEAKMRDRLSRYLTGQIVSKVTDNLPEPVTAE